MCALIDSNAILMALRHPMHIKCLACHCSSCRRWRIGHVAFRFLIQWLGGKRGNCEQSQNVFPILSHWFVVCHMDFTIY